ncbi:MAG: hypothetical protein ACRDS0_27480 [Pseudonocardiaceae bacterium]
MTIEVELRAITARLTDAATPHETLLTGGPIALRVTSTVPELLATLTAATVPYLQPARPDHELASPQSVEQIGVHADSVMADRLRLLDGTPREVGDDIHLVRACAGGGTQFREAFLLWPQATPQTSHLVVEHPGPAADRVTLRLVRGIASRCLITAGWVPLHAAAAVTRAGLIVLAGPSGAGKTTALLHLLANGPGQAFVANDKVYLTIDNSRVYARALPTSLALRPDTTAMFPTLGALGAQANSSHVDNHPDRAGADRRMLVSPRHLADAFGVPLHHGGPVAAIVAVSHDCGGPSRWRRTGPTRALDTVTTGYLDNWFIDEPHEHHRLEVPPTALSAAHHNTLGRIASAVPVIELNAGTDTPQALRAIIADLTGSPDQAEPARGR